MRTLKLSRRSVTAAIVALILTLSVTAPAYADPIASKKAQAAAVQGQISKLNNKAELAAEAYNAAKDRNTKLIAKVNDAEYKISVLQRRQKRLQKALDSRANQVYRSGTMGFIDFLLSARSFDDLEIALKVLTDQNRKDAQTVAAIKDAKVEAIATHKELVVAQADAARTQAQMAEHAYAVRTQLAARQTLLAGINSDIKNLIAQQQAAEAAAARARYAAYLASQASMSADAGGITTGSGRSTRAILDPAGTKGANAVAWAKTKLGCPYVWAAAGPNEFDCSGLTMWAYGKVGVHLPHHAIEQINVGHRVPRSELAPGDLVFFGSPIHHVGMYVGGGMFIEAPYTGANVRIRDLSGRGDYAGACRPY